VTTFTPDTPPHMLSDYTEERCHELGLPCVRDDNGLTVTVPAKADGLPDWGTFLRVCHELKWADGWVMEGAEPERYDDQADWWYRMAGESNECWHVIDCVYDFLCQDDRYKTRYYGRNCDTKALADLSRVCVEYSRSGGGA